MYIFDRSTCVVSDQGVWCLDFSLLPNLILFSLRSYVSFSCSISFILQKWDNQQWDTDFWMYKTSFVALWDKPVPVILDEFDASFTEWVKSQCHLGQQQNTKPWGKMQVWKRLLLICTPEQREKQIMSFRDLRFVQSSHERRAISLQCLSPELLLQLGNLFEL